MTENLDTPNQSEPGDAEATSPKKKRVRGQAVHRLRKAAARTVRDNSTDIAKSLVDHTMEGNMNCARLLLTLLDKKPRDPHKKRKNTVSLADQWAADSQWEEGQLDCSTCPAQKMTPVAAV